MNYFYLSICLFFSFSIFGHFTSQAKPIALSEPEVLLTGWNARCLTNTDLNGDGLTDLIYFNLDKSYIEILYRTKEGSLPKNVRPICGESDSMIDDNATSESMPDTTWPYFAGRCFETK